MRLYEQASGYYQSARRGSRSAFLYLRALTSRRGALGAYQPMEYRPRGVLAQIKRNIILTNYGL